MILNNMGNVYFYSYFFLSSFIKVINKRNGDYRFSGMALLTMFMGFNVFTIISIIFKGKINTINPFLISILITLPLFAINYFFLIGNDKSEIIYTCFRKKWKTEKKKGIIYLIFFLLYAVISLISCGYIAYLIKNHHI